ncbi:GntR family transcriptional regulator [Pseudoalteromonas sp. SMS1]|uniref:UTRA domain-containing protein n=1 Tax=Pseudoalteromonas sp. SMS1 TaxID=2908894 RepID=UPI001F485AE8|nr:UTRA domain-containing protein [Pseudoalteromonas sp. SMS1]MCF2859979.1 GntR family transcriptional regulator [Pseudoalteromonas sp. SMS1]
MLLYQKIRNYIQDLLSQGSMQPGSKLPSERDLQDTFNSTRITVREALARLEAEGVIYSQKRRGWFVTPQKLRWHPARKVNFNRLTNEQGFAPKTEVISIAPPSAMYSIANDYFNGDAVYQLTRVRKLDGRAILMEQIYCLAARFNGLEKQPLNGSITEIMSAQYQVEISHEQCVISVTVLPDDVALKLEKNSGAPCLKVKRARYDVHEQLVDYNIEYWLHDAIEMVVEGV